MVVGCYCVKRELEISRCGSAAFLDLGKFAELDSTSNGGCAYFNHAFDFSHFSLQ
jgi:hypothetical protein